MSVTALRAAVASIMRAMNRDSRVIHCPYCGELLEVAVDWSVRQQEYVEDCQVCCRPITLAIEIDADGDTEIRARAESD